MKEKLSKTTMWLLIAMIPIIILLGSFRNIISDEKFFESEFDKYGVYYDVGLSKEDTLKLNKVLFDYLLNDKTQNSINASIFNDKEKTHLLEVKSLMQSILLKYYILFAVSLVLIALIFIFAKEKEFGMKRVGKALLFGSIITLVLIGLFFIALKFNFDSIFLKFHEVSFKSDTWLLDPSVDKLKAMFPNDIFYDTAAAIAVRTIIQSLFFLAISILIAFYMKRNK